jgi:hypothetical protein
MPLRANFSETDERMGPTSMRRGPGSLRRDSSTGAGDEEGSQGGGLVNITDLIGVEAERSGRGRAFHAIGCAMCGPPWGGINSSQHSSW